MIKVPLKDCQNDLFNFIKDKSYWGVFAEYGVGKTLVALSYIDFHKFKKTLIVGKKTNMTHNGTWLEQIKTFTTFSTASLVDKSLKDKLTLLKTDDDTPFIYLINYESLSDILNTNINFDCVIFDESTKVKSHKTKTFKKCVKLVQNVNHRGILTGCPITENYLNLWSQIYLLDLGKALGKTFWDYLNKYFYKFMYDWYPKKDVQKQILEQISDFCISVKLKDCIELPEPKFTYYSLLPTLKQEKYFKQLKEEFMLDAVDENYKFTTQYILPIYHKLRQICSGFIYTESELNTETITFKTPKDHFLLDLLEEIVSSGNKTIIWCEYKYEIEKLNTLLKRHKYNFITAYQGYDYSDWSDLWKSNKYNIILSTPAILGVGETLLAKYSIRYSYDFSNEKKMNSDARNYRRGSEIFSNIHYIYLFIENSIEERIIKNLSKKKSLVNLVYDYLSQEKK